jgi:hypothetical protein
MASKHDNTTSASWLATFTFQTARISRGALTPPVHPNLLLFKFSNSIYINGGTGGIRGGLPKPALSKGVRAVYEPGQEVCPLSVLNDNCFVEWPLFKYVVPRAALLCNSFILMCKWKKRKTDELLNILRATFDVASSLNDIWCGSDGV